MAKTKENTPSEILIPVNLKLLLKASREYRPLRLFVLRYCKENKIPGFEPFPTPEISFNHNELFDADGNLLPGDKPESTENKN